MLVKYRIFREEGSFYEVWNLEEIPESSEFEIIEILEEPIVVVVPEVVSQRQLRTQLVLTGFNLNDVEVIINSLPEPNKSIAHVAWDYAITFERQSPLLIQLAFALGIDENELNNIFINASKL